MLALAGVIAAMTMAGKVSARDASIVALRARMAEQPLEPATSTRDVRLVPSRNRTFHAPAIVVGGSSAQMADLRIDVGWSSFTTFRVSIDRHDQGRVAVVNYLLRDSNGDLRLALNSSALGPGTYQFAIEGLSLHSDAVAQAWITIGIAHELRAERDQFSSARGAWLSTGRTASQPLAQTSNAAPTTPANHSQPSKW